MFSLRDFFIIYFYICTVNTDRVKDMQILLNDIELDIQELKCLMQAISNDTNPALKIVAKRNIQQMKTRLDALQEVLDKVPIITEPIAEPVVAEPITTTDIITKPVGIDSIVTEPVAHTAESVQPVVSPTSSILAERIKPSTNLRQAISLNDSFRFTRELFDGDSTRMNEVVRLLGEASSLDGAMTVFNSEVSVKEENEAVIDFVELLKKYFS